MRVLILGATGSLGPHLVRQALSQGHELTVLVRDPVRLDPKDPRIRVFQGDALEARFLEPAVAGQEAVVYSIGTRRFSSTTLFSESTRLLIEVMEKCGVRRLLAVTGVGAGDSRGHGGFLYDRIFFPLFLKTLYQDKDRQEERIRKSTLDWTIIRPAAFNDGSARGPFRAETELRGVTLSRIPRAEVASFLFDQLTDNRYLRQAVLIGHEK